MQICTITSSKTTCSLSLFNATWKPTLPTLLNWRAIVIYNTLSRLNARGAVLQTCDNICCLGIFADELITSNIIGIFWMAVRTCKTLEIALPKFWCRWPSWQLFVPNPFLLLLLHANLSNKPTSTTINESQTFPLMNVKHNPISQTHENHLRLFVVTAQRQLLSNAPHSRNLQNCHVLMDLFNALLITLIFSTPFIK